jgi:hypothetical protein
MSTRRPMHVGLLLAWLAVSVQLALGALVPTAVASLSLVDGAPLCHTSDGSETPAPTAPHHPADCLVCPLCASLAVHWALPTSDPPAPAPQQTIVVARVGLPPPAIAPPSLVRPNPPPRAPPIQA